MTKYICKCGRVVAKSTSADNTGNRDTENCKGCPYLLPWGPTQWDAARHAMVTDVKGYECRMSKDIEYATRFCGSIDDKCSCYIASLDFDFLTRVSNWIKETYPGGELNGSFFTDDIRAVEYVSNGRYRMSIGCAQNKKGIAAKAALLHQFFDASGARLDMTPEEEKAHVLAAIEAGKAMAQERKENMDYIISKHEATGRLYAYYKGSFWFWDSHIQRWLLSQFAEDLYQEYRKNVGDFTREDMLAETSAFYLLDDYEVSPNCIETLLQCNPKTAIPAPASAESPEIVDECSEPNCTCSIANGRIVPAQAAVMRVIGVSVMVRRTVLRTDVLIQRSIRKTLPLRPPSPLWMLELPHKAYPMPNLSLWQQHPACVAPAAVRIALGADAIKSVQMDQKDPVLPRYALDTSKGLISFARTR